MFQLYKTRFSLVLTLALMLCSGLLLAQSKQPAFKNGKQQGLVKVKFTPDHFSTISKLGAAAKRSANTGISAFDAVSRKYEAQNLKRLFPKQENPVLEAKLQKHGLHLWFTLEVDETTDPSAIAQAYRNLGEVSIAETNMQKVLSPYNMTPITTQPKAQNASGFNDPYLPDQWHYDNTGQNGVSGNDINLAQAWGITTGSPDVVVAIHDEGVDVNHEDLKENLWVNTAELNGTPGVDDDNNGYVDDIHGWNFDRNVAAIDPQGHGTHVAGTVAAVNNNGIGVSGVAGGSGNQDGARIMSLQALGGAPIEETYIYAANNGAVISQNSWGYTSPNVTEQSVQDAIDYFIAEAGDYPDSPMRGGIVIFAAGNNNSDAAWYPGYVDNVISVASTGPDGVKATYSNYGSWVDISAPGGDFSHGSEAGVLSTLPNNRVGYNHGTSMACPHVSGIAALAIANREHQLTPEELRTKLLTGITDVYAMNPEFTGKLGSGNIDAWLSIQNDQNIAPEAITDLSVDGISQDFANLSWSVPADTDDMKPMEFIIYYHTAPITENNLLEAEQIVIANEWAAGEQTSFQVNGLFGLTTYHFAVVSVDRWGHHSALSNAVSDTTNEGPSINVDENSTDISMNINMTNSPSANHDLMILNEAEGILKWNFLSRHVSTQKAFNSAGVTYPVAQSNGSSIQPSVRRVASAYKVADVENPEIATTAYEPKEYVYVDYPAYVIGDTDVSIPNSSATRYTVKQEEGFNLTHVGMYLKHLRENGPVIVEVRRGYQMEASELLLAQEYTAWSDNEHDARITLEEQLYFEKGESFWIVFHVPSGVLYPLGVGFLNSPAESGNFLMSLNVGKSWDQLKDLIQTDQIVWATKALSQNEYLGEYLTLDPSSGEVEGMGTQSTLLTANGSELINGTYSSNIILASNDGNNQEMRIPVTLEVSGQTPELASIETLDFANVFQGTTKELTFTVKNIGLGNFNDISVTSTNPAFELVGYAPWKIYAKDEANITVRYTPSATAGNDNGKLIISSFSQQESLEVVLFGVSTTPSELTLNPVTQTIDSIALGAAVQAHVTVSNTGKSPMKYFVPGHDTNGIAETWEGDYHSYGYGLRTNAADETNPLPYEYRDISGDGTNITATFLENDLAWYALDLGFDFPFYSEKLSTLYVSGVGFASFTNDVRPINQPVLGNSYGPTGFISPFGGYFDINAGGAVYVKNESDRVIVQYEDIRPDQWSGGMTFQMVLFANGNIRFYYDQVGLGAWNLPYYTVLIEDLQKKDGILVHDYHNQQQITSGTAFGFDYPGPDIITSVSNPSGILLPGESADLEVSMNTATLYEGTITRNLNVISDAPVNGQKIAQIKLNITEGGVSNLFVSRESIAFGELFQGAESSYSFNIKNTGTTPVDITGMNLTNNSYVLDGPTTTTLNPGLAEAYEISLSTEVIGEFNDVLTITDNNDNVYEIALSGTVIAPPMIEVDLAAVSDTLMYGEVKEHDLMISNPGQAPLEVVATGNQWLTMDVKSGTNAAFPNFTYGYEIFTGDEQYNWQDITATGTKLPAILEDATDPEEYFREINLPWPVSFYGEEYQTLYVGEGGAITFEKPASVPLFSEKLPTSSYQTLIAPFWNYGATIEEFFPNEEVGIFYESNDNQIIISWEFSLNFAGIGDAVSYQVILNKNGSMKFQYKLQGNFDGSSIFATIGLQNKDRSDFINISASTKQPLEEDLAITLTPAKKHVVAPGSTLAATVSLHSGSVFAGQYSDNLKIQTNVPGKEFLEKPFSLLVEGDAALEANRSSIDFGEIMAYSTEDGPVTYTQEFAVRNTGVGLLQFSGIGLEIPSTQYKLEMYRYVESWFGPGYWQWSNVDFIWDWPALKPGEQAQFRLTYTPQAEGAMNNQVVINSNIAPLEVPVTAMVVLQPDIQITTDSVFSSLNTTEESEVQSAFFNNEQGLGSLEYAFSINYLRGSAAVNSTASAKKATEKKTAISTLKIESAPRATAQSTFNRELAHDQKIEPDTYLGLQGRSVLTTATRFNAGEQGFNLSHIQTYLLATEATTGTIEYEIRAGGTDVTNAVVLAEGSTDYDTGAYNDGVITIALEEEVGIYPNEDFYVIFHYPLELHFPQGTVADVANAPGRFMLFDGEGWFDLQAGYAEYGWMVRAMEMNYQDHSWVRLVSEQSGTLAKGAQSNIDLEFIGTYALPGDQNAVLVIRTNDPEAPVKEIPLTLHMNEAPYFLDGSSFFELQEGDQFEAEIAISDIENHIITASITDAPEWMSQEFDGTSFKLQLNPGYETAGSYQYTLTATDEYGAQNTHNVTLVIDDTNRAPEIIADDMLAYDETGVYDNRSFDDYFIDPDGDVLTYDLSVADATIANAYASGSDFVVQTAEEGATTLILGATDTSGLRTELVLALEIALVDYEFLTLFPNPAADFIELQWGERWIGSVSVSIVTSSGQVVLARTIDKVEELKTSQIDVSNLSRGLYIVNVEGEEALNQTIKFVKK